MLDKIIEKIFFECYYMSIMLDKGGLKMHIGILIKKYRDTHKLSMAEFAKKANISKAYVSVLEKNKDPRNGKPIIPSIPTIQNVAQGMGLSFDELFNLIGDNELVSLYENNTSTLTLITETAAQLNEDRQLNVLDYTEKQLDEQNQINEELHPYEVTEKLAAASDLPNGFNYDADNNRKFTLYSDKLTTKQYDIASQVIGDSMEPQYHDGDVVLIQKGYDNVNGAIYAVDYDGKTYIKKVYLEDNQFRLVSLNEKYEDILIDLPVDEDLYFNIVGKVVDSFTPVEL